MKILNGNKESFIRTELDLKDRETLNKWFSFYVRIGHKNLIFHMRSLINGPKTPKFCRKYQVKGVYLFQECNLKDANRSSYSSH